MACSKGTSMLLLCYKVGEYFAPLSRPMPSCQQSLCISQLYTSGNSFVEHGSHTTLSLGGIATSKRSPFCAKVMQEKKD